MAKQTFTTGQVLTAAQMTSLQQTAMLGGSASAKVASYTLVAADAGTAITMSNASATTITVNTALFAAGDIVNITNIGAGISTITAGTATVNTSASLALAQYESGTLSFITTSSAVFVKGAGAAPASGQIFTLLNSGGTTLSGASTTISGISGKDTLYILFVSAANATNSATTFLRYNGLSTGIYAYAGPTSQNPTIYAATDNQNAEQATAGTSIPLPQFASSAGSTVKGGVLIQGCNNTGVKVFQTIAGTQATSQVNSINRWNSGIIDSAATCTSIVLHTGSGSFSGGTIYVYGAA